MKHGNWNAHQKTEEEIRKDELERIAMKTQAVMHVARQMFQLLETSDLDEAARTCALEILQSFVRRLT